MVVPCRISPDRRIEVDGYIVCQSLGVKGPVVFTVDTGSKVTSVGHKDAMGMSIRVAQLNPTRETVVGIGGFAASYELPDVDIIFRAGDGATCRLRTAYYHRPVKKKKVKSKGPMRYERESVAAAPSILGMDAIVAMRLVLETDAETYAVLRDRK